MPILLMIALAAGSRLPIDQKSNFLQYDDDSLSDDEQYGGDEDEPYAPDYYFDAYPDVIVGGYSSEYNATPEIQDIINQVKPSVESQIGDLGPYQAVKYTSQLVEGTNYKVKVLIGDNKYIHLEIYEPLDYPDESLLLTDVESGKTYDDPL
jgi:cystatin-A/B